MIREYIVKISDEVMENEIADKPEELVRCRDCKNRSTSYNWCDEVEKYVILDWFCAAGERNEPVEENFMR